MYTVWIELVYLESLIDALILYEPKIGLILTRVGLIGWKVWMRTLFGGVGKGMMFLGTRFKGLVPHPKTRQRESFENKKIKIH